MQHRTKMSAPPADQFLGDSIWVQESTETHEFSSRRVRLFHFLEGERPGRCYRVWIIGELRAAPGKEVFAMDLIDLEVISKATACFFDIRASLVKRQREEIEGNHNIGRLIPLFI